MFNLRPKCDVGHKIGVKVKIQKEINYKSTIGRVSLTRSPMPKKNVKAQKLRRGVNVRKVRLDDADHFLGCVDILHKRYVVLWQL